MANEALCKAQIQSRKRREIPMTKNADSSRAEDMDDDIDYTPRIVILGAGPIGLETALYARYLGYEVAVFEKNNVASSVFRWGHVQMFSPFAMNRSSLGVAAMQAQFEDLPWPADDALLTGKEYADSYLLPLSKTDLLSGCIHENVEVLSIARDGILKSDAVDDRADFQFRILLRTQDGDEVVDADYVIDTSGVYGQGNAIGHGGMLAPGEGSVAPLIRHDVPDVLGAEQDVFAGKRVLVIGCGYSAATSVVRLAELHANESSTAITWITRREMPKGGPLPVHEADPLPQRRLLAERANQASSLAESGVTHFDQTSVLAIQRDHEGVFHVTLGGNIDGVHCFDMILANTGYRPDTTVFRELQVELCERTEAPKPMSTWFSSLGNVDALEQESPGASALQLSEPGFFVLGSKAFGRNSNFLLSLGLQQIRDAFTVIADRKDLDLYKTMASLV